MQALGRRQPVAALHEVVPVGDQVAERAALVAERDAAVHAAAAPARAPRPPRACACTLAVVAEPLARRRQRAEPALHLQEAARLSHARLCRAVGIEFARGPARVVRHHAHEEASDALPVVEQALGDRRAGQRVRAARLSARSSLRRRDGLERAPSRVDSGARAAVGVVDVGEPPDMPAAKLRPVRPSTATMPPGHVLAAVVADALDDGGARPSCARRSARRRAPQVGLAGRRAVQRGVADDGARRAVVGGLRVAAARRAARPRGPCRRSRWRGRRAAARGPRGERAEALAGLPLSRSTIVPGGRPSGPARRTISPETQRADGAVGVAHLARSSTGSPSSSAGRTLREQRAVELAVRLAAALGWRRRASARRRRP